LLEPLLEAREQIKYQRRFHRLALPVRADAVPGDVIFQQVQPGKNPSALGAMGEA